jgi:hypothetical protein
MGVERVTVTYPDIHRPVYYLKLTFRRLDFLRLRVELTQVGPKYRASLSLDAGWYPESILRNVC